MADCKLQGEITGHGVQKRQALSVLSSQHNSELKILNYSIPRD
jgi:hypothetical protein